MSRPIRALIALFLLATLTACGFHLRGSGSGNLPYRSIFIALPETADVRIWLERYIKATGKTEVSDEMKAAEVIFHQVRDNRQKTILSVNALGRVREYRLQLSYSFRLVNQKGQIIIPDNEITLQRDISFDDSSVLAKDLEESLLWRDMTTDLVNQIMRRLSILKPINPNREPGE